MFVLPEGVRYYIVRSDNAMIPLVPADQLPYQLHGLPRQIDHGQLSAQKWIYISSTKEKPIPLTAQTPSILPTSMSTLVEAAVPLSPAPSPKHYAPDHDVRTASWRISANPTAMIADTPLREQVPQKILAKENIVQETPKESLTQSIASIYHKETSPRIGYAPYGVLPSPSGIEPDPSKKEYCTHWIKTGECAFTSQGCRFKHEMPPIYKLREIGFTSIPRWFKEKQAMPIRGPTWMERRMMQADGSLDQNTSVPMFAPASPRHGAVRELFKHIERDSNRAMAQDREGMNGQVLPILPSPKHEEAELSQNAYKNAVQPRDKIDVIKKPRHVTTAEMSEDDATSLSELSVGRGLSPSSPLTTKSSFKTRHSITDDVPNLIDFEDMSEISSRRSSISTSPSSISLEHPGPHSTPQISAKEHRDAEIGGTRSNGHAFRAQGEVKAGSTRKIVPENQIEISSAGSGDDHNYYPARKHRRNASKNAATSGAATAKKAGLARSQWASTSVQEAPSAPTARGVNIAGDASGISRIQKQRVEPKVGSVRHEKRPARRAAKSKPKPT